ncbi:MAG: hypothetical protein CMJ59_01000 [Planctomycetaceae bacterium]|nr:hypothetical protein [Planctomycetaceae bacterium]
MTVEMVDRSRLRRGVALAACGLCAASLYDDASGACSVRLYRFGGRLRSTLLAAALGSGS